MTKQAAQTTSSKNKNGFFSRLCYTAFYPAPIGEVKNIIRMGKQKLSAEKHKELLNDFDFTPPASNFVYTYKGFFTALAVKLNIREKTDNDLTLTLSTTYNRNESNLLHLLVLPMSDAFLQSCKIGFSTQQYEALKKWRAYFYHLENEEKAELPTFHQDPEEKSYELKM